MSTRYNNGSHYENHQRAAELHDVAAHAHRAAAQHGHGEHLTGHEQSRRALELSWQAHQHSASLSFSHETIAAVAYKLWEARGCPDGSPEEDWLHAQESLSAYTL
jgi:hypothetical protein